MDYSVFGKPFPSYRWRWGASTPTESLNIPAVYVGCLKVLYENQGLSPNEQSVFDGLQKVENDLSSLNLPTLAREPERNLFRNSGQYWKVTGLLDSTNNGIQLSELGVAYATGKINQSEFASFTIKTMTLPNPQLESSQCVDDWTEKDLFIKPLELVLALVASLFREDEELGYLTAEELVNVIIPLSGNKCSLIEMVASIKDFRRNPALFSGAWSANERANDSRIAREFLLFLNNYDFLGVRDTRDSTKVVRNLTQEFFLFEDQLESICALLELDVSALPSQQTVDENSIDTAIEIDQETQVVDSARERKQVEILSRPSQAKFRREVLKAGGGVCILSGVAIKEALQACHIIPVKNSGSDDKSNGFIIRSDLHTLYDKGHIRISDCGAVSLSEYLKKDLDYSCSIPKEVEIPSYVSKDAIRMRNDYSM
tara:strand:+ start:3834 stop:5117 length:1284 start_codon:yes stop_codon:yes gene_type:complete